MKHPITVSGPSGVCGTLAEVPATDAGVVMLTLPSGERAEVRVEDLEAGPDGSYRLRGSAHANLSISPQPPEQTVAGGSAVVVPVVAEELTVGKHEVVTGGVRVDVRTTTRTEAVDLALTWEHVEVERVPVNRFVERAEQPRTEENVTIIPVYEEVLVVERRLRLKEEVRIRRHVETRQEHREVPVRAEAASVSRIDV